jgi:hypothetical protein
LDDDDDPQAAMANMVMVVMSKKPSERIAHLHWLMLKTGIGSKRILKNLLPTLKTLRKKTGYLIFMWAFSARMAMSDKFKVLVVHQAD